MAINFDQNRSGLLGIDTGINYDQMAFNPGSLKDTLIKNLYNIEQETGFSNPQLDKLKQEDIKQFQKKGTPLSLPSNAYTAMAIKNYDDLFSPQTMVDSLGVNRTTLGLNRPDLNTAPFNVNEVSTDGITNNIRFRDMLLNDIRNLPSDIRTGLGQTKNAFLEDISGLKKGLGSIKDKGIDLGRMIGSGIGRYALGPVGGIIGSLIGSLKESPEQKAMKDFYGSEFGLDDIGRVQSGIMKGYSPVSMFGGVGLNQAIDKRIARINKTLAKQKKNRSKVLENRLKELKKLRAKESAASSAALEAQRTGRRPGTGGDRGGVKDSEGPTGGYSYDSGGREGFGYGL